MFGQEGGDAAEFTFLVAVEAGKTGTIPEWKGQLLQLGLLVAVKGLYASRRCSKMSRMLMTSVEFGRLGVRLSKIQEYFHSTLP